MFVLGLIVLFGTGFYANPSPTARLATHGLVILAILTTIFLSVVVAPASKTIERTIGGKIPFIGGS